MNKKWGYITIVEVILTIVLVAYLLLCHLYANDNSMFLNWLGIVVFVYAIITWKYKTNSSWFSPYTILFVFFVMFNYGIPIMWAFNIHLPNELGTKEMFFGTGYYPTKMDIINSQWYVCMGMLLFHFGALLFAKRNMNSLSGETEIFDNLCDYTNIKKAMRLVGGCLLFIISPIAIYFRAKEVMIAQTYGYRYLYYGALNTQGGYVQILLYLFFPALVCFLIGSDYSKKSRKLVFLIFAIYAILGILSGDRGGWLYSLIILIWLHTHYVKTPIKKYMLYAFLGVIGVYFLSVITSTRNTGLSFTIDDFINVFSAEKSPIVSAFFEMGGTMGIIVYFLHSGRGIFPYGNTYVTAIFGAVSSRLLNLFDLKQVLIANWFSQDYLGLKDYGTGFSMIGEAYINGGYIGGLIYMFIWGAIIGKAIQYSSKTDSSPINLFITTATLNVVVGFARSDCYLVIKEFFYGVLCVLLMIRFFSGTKRQACNAQNFETNNY